jgi:outer membrane protein insertion porin family/translocation and assembly module TamA
VTFVDASNVSLDELSFDFTAPHVSTGFGLRYITPVGPFRFDLGYRVPGAQRLGGGSGNGIRRDAHPEALIDPWLPIELHLSLGEAF